MKKAILILALILSIPFGVMFSVGYWMWSHNPPLTSDPRVEVLGAYGTSKVSWKVLLIPKNLSREELISLAREFHTNRPVTHFELYDAAAQVGEYLAWEKDPARHPFPAEFVRRHRVAVIGPIISTTVNAWCLFRAGEDLESLQYGHRRITFIPGENIIACFE